VRVDLQHHRLRCMPQLAADRVETDRRTTIERLEPSSKVRVPEHLRANLTGLPAGALGDMVDQLPRVGDQHDWGAAAKAGDAGKLGQILADDWIGVGYDGKKATKKSILADLKSDALKVESFEFGPMDVKVLGNVAVVQGSDTEKSTTSGKDTSGK